MNSVIKIDPEIMSGTPCFVGTRVPIQNLIDYLEGGDSIDEFLEDFPSVRRDQVISFLEEAKESVLVRHPGDAASTKRRLTNLATNRPLSDNRPQIAFRRHY